MNNSENEHCAMQRAVFHSSKEEHVRTDKRNAKEEKRRYTEVNRQIQIINKKLNFPSCERGFSPFHFFLKHASLENLSVFYLPL